MEIRSDIARIADFLEGQDIRPEGVDKAFPSLFQQFAQCQARIEQQVLLLLLRHLLCAFRIIVVTENVVRHCLDIKARALVRDRDPFSQLHKVVRIHVFLYKLCTALRAGQG